MKRQHSNSRPRLGERLAVVVCLASALLACAHEGSEQASSGNPAGSAPPDRASAGDPGACGQVDNASVELAALDRRRPVPLLPMMAWHQKQSMMGHLVAIEQIVSAAAKEDWAGVAEAAKAIEASEAQRQMCEHMGAGAEGFTRLALDFHDRASAIGKAAEAGDGPQVLAATANTLQACTGCHATFRQDVVDQSTWMDRTGTTHMPVPESH